MTSPSAKRLRLVAPALIVAGAVIGVTAGACSLLDEPSQCATDGDCVRFNAVCDIRQAVCVDRSLVEGGTPGTPTDEGGTNLPDATDDSPPLPADCTVAVKPVVNASTGLATGPAVDGGVSSQVTGNHTLGCEKEWSLDGHIIVGEGATLTIQAGTILRAKRGARAAIVVLPGGKLIAEGQKNGPIVFTSDDTKAGDWRGIFILGKAPRNGNMGYQGDPLLMYGGADMNDNSGVLKFIRIEYAQDGIVFGGVGKGTQVDSIQVRHSNDNCFVMNGGAFTAKHLICQQTLDEMFEIQEGYNGRLQYLYGQKIAPGAGHNGLLLDGNNTAPLISNVTLCGQNNAQNVQGFGLVFRNNSRLDLSNAVITGWATGLDVGPNPGAANHRLRSARFFGNALNPVTEDDGGVGGGADDMGFDEAAFFGDGGGNNAANINLMDCHNLNQPAPWPQAMVTGVAPPADPALDSAANYIGAFKDATDTWHAGWTKFGP